MHHSNVCRDSRLKKELTLASPVGSGKSAAARKVQQYLWVNGIKPVIDGDWGTGTQAAIDQFCQKAGIPPQQSVDQALMDRLAQPLLRAAHAIAQQASFQASIVAFAKQQLAEHPVEIDGANMGPWVRFYMSGHEGKDWLWCAGFVTYIVRYCATLHAQPSPVSRTFSCDVLAMEAKQSGRFRSKGTLAQIPAGSIFLVRRPNASNDWVHTGIVLDHKNGTIITAEGNTDQGGSSNGFEATSRIRNAANVDIIVT